MHQLVYISAATPAMSSQGLVQILDSARKFNALHDIHGMLMYHSQQFFQVLEGPEPALRTCFQRIERDPRHTGIIMLADHPTERPCFHGWDMAAVELTDFEYSLRSQVISLLELRSHVQYEELHANKAIGIFADTYLADLDRFAAKIDI